MLGDIGDHLLTNCMSFYQCMMRFVYVSFWNVVHELSFTEILITATIVEVLQFV